MGAIPKKLRALALGGLLLAGCGGGGGDQPAGPTNDLEAFTKAFDRFGAQVAPVLTGGAKPAPGRSYEIVRALPGARLVLRVAPAADAPILARSGPKTEFGTALTFHVAEHRGDWLGVTSAASPDNELAWVRFDRDSLVDYRTNFSIDADLSRQSVRVLYGDQVVKEFPVTVGRAGHETPPGTYSVTDALAGEGVGPYYGCCVLALSGHQPNLPPGWIGGDRIAIHGTPGSVGGAASAGCLRASDEDMAALFLLVPLGAPVFIRR